MKKQLLILSDSRRRFILVSCVLLGSAFIFGCFLNAKRILESTRDTHEQLPIRSLTITMDPRHREDLFRQLQEFADQNDFEIVISDYGSGGENYLVWMSRSDILIQALHHSQDSDVVFLGVYDQARATLVPEETLKTMDELLSTLKSMSSEIPDVTIREQ